MSYKIEFSTQLVTIGAYLSTYLPEWEDRKAITNLVGISIWRIQEFRLHISKFYLLTFP